MKTRAARTRRRRAPRISKVLITGTSRGIGYDTTLLLARQGREVVATMRNPGASDLEKVAREERLAVTVLPMDVDDDASVAGVFAEPGPSIEVLVNNAGSTESRRWRTKGSTGSDR